MNITLPQPIRNAGRLSFYGGAESKIYMDNLKLYDADLESLSPSAAKKEVQVDRYASAEVPIYPVSQAANDMILADDYTYTISGEHTEDFSIVRGGVLVVPETAAVGTAATVTATSKYNPQLTASTTVEIIGGLSKKIELFEGTKKLASPQEAEGTAIAAKLALTNDTTVAYSEGVIAAVYKNGVLVDAGVGAVKDLIGETVVTLDLKLPEDKTGVAVKIFGLESLTTLKPLHAPECFAEEKK